LLTQIRKFNQYEVVAILGVVEGVKALVNLSAVSQQNNWQESNLRTKWFIIAFVVMVWLVLW
jgi:hypothetical protein